MRNDPSEPNNDKKKSALDVVIVSERLVKYIEKLEIDSNLQYALEVHVFLGMRFISRSCTEKCCDLNQLTRFPPHAPSLRISP